MPNNCITEDPTSSKIPDPLHSSLQSLKRQADWPDTIKRLMAGFDAPRRLAIAFDTSSAPPPGYIKHVWNKLHDLATELQLETVRVVQCDMEIRSDETYSHENLPRELRFVGRGGTSSLPVFRLLENDPPHALVYISDLYTDLWALHRPHWHTFWIVGPDHRAPADPHFGTVLNVTHQTG